MIINEIELTPASAEYLQEIVESLPEKEVTQSDAVNYALETLQAIEAMLLAIGINDPVDFVTGLSDGSILIVKR